MYYFLSLMTGVIISFMVSVNGLLDKNLGLSVSTFVIHLCGLVTITIVLLIKKVRPFQKICHWFWYMGGALGIFTVLFNNMAFGKISVSSMMALALLGSCIASLVIDNTGCMGAPKRAFNMRKIPGLLIVLAGIIYMMEDFEWLAVIVSLMAGMNTVITRTINARLAEETSVTESTFMNYISGTIASLLLCVIMGFGDIGNMIAQNDWNVWMFLGGTCGVVIIYIFNIVVFKVSAFSLSLLSFVGQMIVSILIDWAMTGGGSAQLVIGSVVVCVGLGVHLYLSSAKTDNIDNEKGVSVK